MEREFRTGRRCLYNWNKNLKKLFYILIFVLLRFTLANAQMNSSEYYKLYNQYISGDSTGMYKKIFTAEKENFYHYLAKSDYYILLHDTKNSLAQISLAEKVCPKEDSLIAFCNYKIGYFYFFHNNYPEALKYFNKAANFINAKPTKNWHARLYIQIGAIHNTLGSNESAVRDFLLTLNYYRAKNDKLRLMNAMNNLAIAYMDKGEFEKSEIYFDSCLNYRIANNDFYGIGQVQNNIGTLYFKKTQYEKALNNYLIGYENRQKGNVPMPGIIESRINIGKTYLKLKQYHESVKWLESAYELAIDINHTDLQKRSTEHLKVVYYELKDYQKAYQIQEKYFRLYDTLYGLDKKIEVENLEMQNELQSKMYQDSIVTAEQIKSEKLISEEKEKRNWIIFISLGGGILFLSYFVFQLYRSNKQRKNTNAIILEQKNILDQKQKEILDSFHYAKRIQYTLLAHEEFLKQNLREHFVLFMPKDIVSGDFYWCTKKGNDFYLAICDCTGHGVPGAFMSLLNITFLNEAINEKNISEPNLVLNHVRERLIQNMEGAQDGMDATLVKINGSKMHYSSAQNKPILIRNNEIIELKADKMPVGKGEKTDSFSQFELDLLKNDVLYFYTDGFADQFGGPNGKKFKYSNLQKLLLENSDKVMNFQLQNLKNNFTNWQGNLEQVDDVCIIGIRI